MSDRESLQWNIYMDEAVEICDLNFYPVSVKDFLIFHSCIDCLTIEKNALEGIDPFEMVKIIKMSYLEYVYYNINKEAQEISNPYDRFFTIRFYSLLRLCLRYDFDFSGS